MSETPLALQAERLRLSAREGQVFGPLTFDAPKGALVALHGPSGSGKTALLLALAGRMRGWHGRASVCGLDLARDAWRIRGLVGLGTNRGVNDPAPGLTLRQAVAEQRIFVARRERSAHPDVLALVGLDAMAAMRPSSLDAEQRVRLGIALALVRDIRVLVLDDLDRDLDNGQQARVLELLRELADDGLTVMFACTNARAAGLADQVIAMHAAQVELTEVLRDAVA